MVARRLGRSHRWHRCDLSSLNSVPLSQIEYTNRILNSIQKGLLLEVRDTGIYAVRQDRCHVFASTSNPSVAPLEPSKLPQNSMVELLSFAKYVHGRCCCWALWGKRPPLSAVCCCWASRLCPELKLFKEDNGGSPEYTITMCFGEKFPDGKALEKKLVTVKVRLLSNSLPSEMCKESNSCPLLAPAGGPSNMSTLSWDGPFGGSNISSQLQHQPADLTQQSLRSHQLRVRTAGAAGAGQACCGFSTTDLTVSGLVLIPSGGGAEANPSRDRSNRPHCLRMEAVIRVGFPDANFF